MAALTKPCIDVFQEARDKVAKDIAVTIFHLENKQNEMFAEINKLEKEFKGKQQQQHKELNKLNSMIARTEEELADNNLVQVQHTVIRDLQRGIDKLSLEIESSREPGYKLKVVWGACINCFALNISKSEISVIETPREPPVPPPQPDPPRSANWKKRRNRRNRNRSVPRDAPQERPFSASEDTHVFRDNFGNRRNCAPDSNRGFIRSRGCAEVPKEACIDDDSW